MLRMVRGSAAFSATGLPSSPVTVTVVASALAGMSAVTRSARGKIWRNDMRRSEAHAQAPRKTQGPELSPSAHQYRVRARGAEQLDRAQRLRVGEGADAHLRKEAVVPEQVVLEQDFLHHLLRAADPERPARRAQLVELRAGHRRPPSLAPDAGHHRGVGGEELVGRALRGLGDVGVRVDADRQRRRIVPGLARDVAVEVDERREALGRAADDRDRQRQGERRRAHDRLRRPAHREPHRQRVLHRPRIRP